jgi:hypothetical protein
MLQNIADIFIYDFKAHCFVSRVDIPELLYM